MNTKSYHDLMEWLMGLDERVERVEVER
jgi:hypothetical protein